MDLIVTLVGGLLAGLVALIVNRVSARSDQRTARRQRYTADIGELHRSVTDYCGDLHAATDGAEFDDPEARRAILIGSADLIRFLTRFALDPKPVADAAHELSEHVSGAMAGLFGASPEMSSTADAVHDAHDRLVEALRADAAD